MKFDNFINIEFSSDNLDRYYIRSSIKAALDNYIPYFKGNFLDVGCGKMPYKTYILEKSKIEKYVGLDIDTAIVYDSNVKPDLFWNGIEMPIKDNEFDTVMATEVFEHCPDPTAILKEINRVMRKDGILFFTVPFLWNLHEVPHDEYRYTPFSLERHLKEAGFINIKIQATGGWHASMAQMLALWICRAPMPSKKRSLIKKLIKPICKYLINKDKLYPIKFSEGQMITGLYGVASKL